MIDEIRIYYESYEQALHFVKPALTIFNSLPIFLIKKSKDYKKYSSRLAPIVFWKDQDILISVVSNKIEYPIVAIEFSTAVFTEDHELQRSDSLASSSENNCLYIKISPTKKRSPSDHGGNIDFDFSEPFRLIFNKTKNISFHIEWPLLEDNDTLIKNDETYLSCPPKNKGFEEIIKKVFTYLINLKEIKSDWLNLLTKDILNNNIPIENESLKIWISKFKEQKNFNHSLISSSRTNLSKDGELTLKINRFGHAMDPERGMLVFYGNIYEKVRTKFIFNKNIKSWYKDTPKEKVIEAIIKNSGIKDKKTLLRIFSLGTGLSDNKSFNEIINNLSENNLVINIDKFLESSYELLNKSLRTIFRYSNSLLITNETNTNSILLTWDNKLLIFKNENFKEITKICERNDYDEDDITYITVHQVLRANKAKIVSVSYPGAQGDRAILPESSLGRRQIRKYIDIISIISNKYINLNESKGKFNISEIKSDIEKLNNYRVNKEYKDALYVLINKINDQMKDKEILLSVSFWMNSKTNLKQIPTNEIDFFVAINFDKKQWKIWRGGNSNFFEIYEGKIYLDKTFEII